MCIRDRLRLALNLFPPLLLAWLGYFLSGRCWCGVLLSGLFGCLLYTSDKRPYETFEQSDFLPFRAGMGAGAPFVLVSHNVVECMDAALPASLSPAVHEVLRETLGFDGIVITDDLAMDAVKQYANGEDVYKRQP